MAIEGMMKVLGFNDYEKYVDRCYNGEESVAKFKKAVDEGEPDRYPLIITDCNMPFLDGYQASIKIRHIYKEAVLDIEGEGPEIIAVTGHVEPVYIKKAKESCIDKIYPKPFRIDVLGRLLQKHGFI